MIDIRWSPLGADSGRKPRPKQIRKQRAQRLFNGWAGGKTYADLAAAEGLTIEQVRKIIRYYVRELWRTHYKWRMAEARCHALAIELRLLRLGKDCPDQPIESLSPPACWLKAFRRAGVETVNHLRTVDAETLLVRLRFPAGAIDWAIMKLDKLGLSHVLKRPESRAATGKIIAF